MKNVKTKLLRKRSLPLTMENTTAKDVINKIKQKKNCDHFLHDDVILKYKRKSNYSRSFSLYSEIFYISTLLGSLRWN